MLLKFDKALFCWILSDKTREKKTELDDSVSFVLYVLCCKNQEQKGILRFRTEF